MGGAEVLSAEVLRRWAFAALEALGAARARIDDLNVFPVPDGDTGTNMYLTWAAACEALPGEDASLAETVAAFGRGALLGARGNSGVITSQLLRAFGVRLAEASDPGARDFAAALEVAVDSAYQAIAQPVEGTILTVARAAADAAKRKADGSLAEVCLASLAGARVALHRTTEQLEPLRRAGVVDAGGAGLVVILTAIELVLTGRHRPDPMAGIPARPRPAAVAEPGCDGEGDGPGFEVMYLLEAADQDIDQLRGTLDRLGDSVVVVGGDRLWNVHVHTDDVGAAIEAGIEAGRPYRIRVTHFGTSQEEPVEQRVVIAVAAGKGLQRLFEQAGARTIPGGPGRRCSTGELLQAIEQSGAAEVVLLPNDKDSIAVAEAAATAARQNGIRTAVIPTRAQVQGLAAVAVHDPERGFDDAVVQLSAAAGQTRHGAVTIAVKDAWTMAGTCRVGDALGVVDGDFVLITEDLTEAALGVLDRLLGGGGELVTVVRGRDCSPELVDAVERHARRGRPAVDVCVYDGGQERYPLLIGVE